MLGHLENGLQRDGEEETLRTNGDIRSLLNLLFKSRCGQMNAAGGHSVVRVHQSEHFNKGAKTVFKSNGKHFYIDLHLEPEVQNIWPDLL